MGHFTVPDFTDGLGAWPVPLGMVIQKTMEFAIFSPWHMSGLPFKLSGLAKRTVSESQSAHISGQ